MVKREIFNKKLLIALSIIFSILCLSACKEETIIDDESDRPVILIGSSDYPPFVELDNNGEPTGLDIDILKEAANRIGYDIKLVTINWEDKDKHFEDGDIDCVTGGFTIDGREDDYLWIGPYINSNQVVVVNETSDIDGLEDLEGKTIAVQSSGIAEDILLEKKNSSIPDNIQIFSYEDNALPFAALGCNYIDALVADEPAVNQYMEDYDVSFKILDEPLMVASVGTAFVKDGDEELCNKLNKAIYDMYKDGTLEKIIGTYFEDVDRYLGGIDFEK